MSSLARDAAYPLLRLLSLTPKRDLFFKEKFDCIREHYGPTCIDVGSGGGEFAHALRDRGHDVTPLEIAGHTVRDTGATLFDGRTIPFADRSFDTATCMFVLHHATDQAQLLRELGRVARQTIIIGEDLPENPLDKVIGAFHLWSTDWGRSPSGFHTDAGWRAIFARLGWTLVHTQSIPRTRHIVSPITRCVYVLRPAA